VTRAVGYAPAMRPELGTSLLSVLFAAGAAFAQATQKPVERADETLRPAPAAERFEPVLDEWWQDAVFYEVFVRSFADSTSGPLAGDGVGDIRGLIERLDYLNDGNPETDTDLGVTALWLMPITESPSYHGYDTTDYRVVERDYGTNKDFRDLVAACDERGIRVTIDLVLNHCSRDHPWFEWSAQNVGSFRDWFIWRDEHPGWNGPWNQPVWHERDGAFYYGLFWGGMPDLNYENPEVTREMLDVVRFWLEDMGLDGFRMDAIRHLIEDGQVQDNTPGTHEWLQTYFRHVKSINPEAMSVGEIWAPSDDVSRYVGDQMDLAFEFWLAESIVTSVRDRSSTAFNERMAIVNRLYPTGMYATFLRNHDQPRVMHALGGDVEAARLAASVQFALPGVPYIYYGEEIGMTADKPDPQIRTPMQWNDTQNAGFSSAEPWIAPKPDYTKVNVAAQSGDPASLLSHYRTLVRLRLGNETLRKGRLVPVEVGDDRLLVFRRLGDDELLCVFNLSDESVSAEALPEWIRSRVGSDLLSGEEGVPRALLPRGAHYFVLRD